MQQQRTVGLSLCAATLRTIQWCCMVVACLAGCSLFTTGHHAVEGHRPAAPYRWRHGDDQAKSESCWAT